MSAISTDEEREDRHYCGMEDHKNDGDWIEPDPEPEPPRTPTPVRLVKVGSPPCTRQALPQPGVGPRRGPCHGRIYDGACTVCRRPARVA